MTQEAITHLREVLGLGVQSERLPATDPRIEELERLKREATEAQERTRQEATKNFESSMTRTFSELLDGRVATELKRLNPAMTESALKRAHDEIVEGVIGKLTSNQWLSNEVQNLARRGDYGADHLKQVVELIARHANPLIAPTVSAVMRDWTENIVKANGQQLSKAKEIAGKKEVPVGSDAPRDGNGRFKKVVPSSELYRKFTDDDILNEKHLQ